MITQYGMSQKFGLMGLASQENQYLSGRAVLNCGDDTATEIDHEVMQLLHYSYEEAKRLLNEHREALDKIAGYLISRETITGKEFMKIFREVKGLPEPEIRIVHDIDPAVGHFPLVAYIHHVVDDRSKDAKCIRKRVKRHAGKQHL